MKNIQPLDFDKLEIKPMAVITRALATSMAIWILVRQLKGVLPGAVQMNKSILREIKGLTGKRSNIICFLPI